MNCPSCGQGVEQGASYCTNCGTRWSGSPTADYNYGSNSFGGNEAAMNASGETWQWYTRPESARIQTVNATASNPSATKRAFAMTLYVGGLFGMLFGLCVRDKDDAFITHHLNNVVVIFIGTIIGFMLSIVLVGSLLLLYLFVMTIMGIASAYNGTREELPLIGKIHIIK